VFCALNRTLRRQRRRLATLAVMLSLVGAVVVAHSAMGHDQTGSALVTCLAVAETAVVGVGVALALGAWMRRPRWLVTAPLEPRPAAFVASPAGVRVRAGPPGLQVFRL
jgi:hypothetical protein